MDYSRLCDELCNIRDVIAAVVVDKGLMVAAAAGRESAPELDNTRLSKLLTQLHILASIPRANEDIAGKAEYVIIQHGSIRVVVMPLDKDRELILATKENPPPDAMIERARILLKKV